MEDGINKICKLRYVNIALYGLRENPRVWYDCFDSFLGKLGFKRSKYDYCLYVMRDGDDMIYLIIFVDDLLICCKSKEKIENIKSLLSKRFKMKDLDKVKNYLGINIDHDYETNIMTQESYIETLANKYKIENSTLYNTPMEVNLRLEPTQEICHDIRYRNLIGALLYISSGTRPDISKLLEQIPKLL